MIQSPKKQEDGLKPRRELNRFCSRRFRIEEKLNKSFSVKIIIILKNTILHHICQRCILNILLNYTSTIKSTIITMVKPNITW